MNVKWNPGVQSLSFTVYLLQCAKASLDVRQGAVTLLRARIFN